MLHPSYTDLMRVVNSDVEIGEEPVVNSRYSIVIATAKRARQLIAGSEPLIKKDEAYGKKAFSIAVDELYRGKVKILGDDSEDEYQESYEPEEEGYLAEEEMYELDDLEVIEEHLEADFELDLEEAEEEAEEELEHEVESLERTVEED